MSNRDTPNMINNNRTLKAISPLYCKRTQAGRDILSVSIYKLLEKSFYKCTVNCNTPCLSRILTCFIFITDYRIKLNKEDVHGLAKGVHNLLIFFPKTY